MGVRAAQQYLVDQVQEVYRSQGVDIHDKHIETDRAPDAAPGPGGQPNDSTSCPPSWSTTRSSGRPTRQLVADGKQPAEGRPELMGITKASLATDSWLSAASFQETTRVLTEAAICRAGPTSCAASRRTSSSAS
jgi:DNA-directed RNA polymerase subunit beta'